MSVRTIQRVVPKTADYTVKAAVDPSGTCFSNRGATGTVIFTLPTPNRNCLGHVYNFRTVADFTITVAGATASDLIALNDVAANSLSASTNSQKLGAAMRAECMESAEGTFKWLVFGMAVGVTYTVAT